MVYSWGTNWNGQLGRGDFLSINIPITPIHCLLTQAITMITCGESHTLFLTVSGNLYSCGSNRFGELGHGDDKPRVRPTFIQASAYPHFNFISSGMFHNLALTVEGKLYSWGSNSHGQLGYDESTCKNIPKKIDFFKNINVHSCSAGSRHSICSTNDKIFSWGCGSSGQLGLGDTKSRSLPSPIPNSSSPSTVITGSDFTYILPQYTISTYSFGFEIGEIQELGKKNIELLKHKIQVIFSSVSCLNASFLNIDANDENWHYNTSKEISGLNMNEIRKAFVHLVNSYEDTPILMTILANSTFKLVKTLQSLPFPTPSSLRVFLILLEVPWMLQASQYNVVLEDLTRAILGLSEENKNTLISWWSKLPILFITRVLEVFKGYLYFILSNSNIDNIILSSVVLVLDLIYKAVNKGHQIPLEEFVQPLLSKKINLMQDFENWISTSGRVFSFCNYPYLLDLEAKQILLKIETNLLMKQMMLVALMEHTEPIFTLSVNREQVYQHVKNELLNYVSGLAEFPPFHLKKPMKVQFIGEDGIDDGGLTLELFYLLTEHIFNPETKLFTIESESYFSWFNIQHQIDTNDYILVGIIIGMAIFNGVILNIQLPTVVYKMLLGCDISVDDLAQLKPTVAKQLRNLISLSSEELEACELYFEILINGEVKELRSQGSSIPVTQENLKLYISLYVKYYLYDSISSSFDAFKKGFWLICNGKVMNLLRPSELEVLICGSTKIDFTELQKITKYQNGYKPQSEVIQWFWEVLHELSYEQKKHFLLFATGAPRAPVNGLSTINFTIQRSGPHSDHLPVAHTCYNIIDLPVSI